MKVDNTTTTSSRKRRREEIFPSTLRSASLSNFFVVLITSYVAFYSPLLCCEAFVPATTSSISTHTCAPTLGQHHASSLFAKEAETTEASEEEDIATYYSPNAALDPTKFRYDLEDENEGNDQSLTTAEKAMNQQAQATQNSTSIRSLTKPPSLSVLVLEARVRPPTKRASVDRTDNRTEATVDEVEMSSWR